MEFGLFELRGPSFMQKAQGADLEDPDEYRAVSIFWVPKEARWSHLTDNATPAHHRQAGGRRDERGSAEFGLFELRGPSFEQKLRAC